MILTATIDKPEEDSSVPLIDREMNSEDLFKVICTMRDFIDAFGTHKQTSLWTEEEKASAINRLCNQLSSVGRANHHEVPYAAHLSNGLELLKASLVKSLTTEEPHIETFTDEGMEHFTTYVN